ncbi:MAG: glycosyltransferase [Ginsengibacter sp.]
MTIEEIKPQSYPLISIVLPVYNGGTYLASSVESVIDQPLKNFELLILDDCSSDDSWKYIKSIKDQRISIYKNEVNKGLFYNLNYLIKNCRSPLIKLWAQDDIMHPHCLETFVSFHQNNPSIGFSYCGCDIINEKGIIKRIDEIDNTPEIVSTELHARIAFFTGSIAGNISNVCINKKALNIAGWFNVGMKISADFDMWVRLAKDHNTGFIADKLIQLRDHGGQLSRKESLYINHVKEDLIVYRNLFSYVSPEMKKEGLMLLRNHKLVFYYTLMVKALIKGNLKTAYSFYKELSAFDNFYKLTSFFIKNKLNRPHTPNLLKPVI